jgi:formylglycine-generating enzyme required for sulfatase activity
MGKHNNPSKFNSCGDSCPVDSVSYDMAQDFIRKLNLKTQKRYRLPTEAEWEYACRAGGSALYCGGNEIGQLAWYEGNSGNKSLPFERRASDTCQLDYGGGYSLPVALRMPNAWGLYDMSGNLAEWVQDNAHYNYEGAPTDGSAWNTPDTGEFSSYRVLRGGSWNSGARYTGATYRNFVDATITSADIGFRVVRSLP